MGTVSRTGARVSGKSKKKRSPWRRRFWIAFCSLFIVGSIGFLVFAYKFNQALGWAETKVQNLDTFKTQLATTPTIIYAADNTPIYRLQNEFRRSVEFKDIPDLVKKATLAAEDKGFYDHHGVNWLAVGRAVAVNAASGSKSQGASTITMQLAKRLYTSAEKSYDRKMKDMALAMQIERRKTKDEILTLYLNQVYYGAGAYGIAAAADVYFDKKLDELSVGEAAMIAGLVQRPSKDNPFDDPEAAMRRRNYVLRQMRDEAWITQKEYEAATKETPKLAKRSFGSGEKILGAPYYVRYILDQLDHLAPELKEELSKGGYKIYTTLNMDIQKIAEQEVRDVVNKYKKQRVRTGAFVLLDADGKILAMVGGVDYDRNQFNMVYQGKRQPGSSFKPFVYAAALSTGVIGPNDMISNKPLLIDEPGKRPRYWPKGGSKYGDEVSVPTAIKASLNAAAAHVIQMVTPQVAVSYAKDVFGIHSTLDPVLPLVLGSSAVSPLEMAEAYSVFMLQGDRVEPFGITKIEGPNGEVLHEFKSVVRHNLLDPVVAGWLDDDLRGVVMSGTATLARAVPNARGKTGTTSDNRDAWFCGYTNNYVGVGWVSGERREGNATVYDPMIGVFGGKVTVQIWVGVMKKVVAKYGDGENRPATKKRVPAGGIIEPMPVDPPVDDVAGATGNETIPPGAVVNPDTGEGAPPVITPPDSTNPPTTGTTTGGAGTTTGGGQGTTTGTGGNGNGNTTTTGGGTGNTQPPPKQNPPKTNEREHPEDMVEVEICVDSGDIATMYCPETVTRKFKKSKAPKSRCHIHGPHDHK